MIGRALQQSSREAIDEASRQESIRTRRVLTTKDQSMKKRLLSTFGVIAMLMTFMSPAAHATAGPSSLRRLAVAQTQLLFKYFDGPSQIASPRSCNQGQSDEGVHGVFLLPTKIASHGDRSFQCNIEAKAVLVDLGGGFASEDKRGDTYTLKNGKVLLFKKADLPRICDDAIRYFPTSAPATVDNRKITGTTVITANFTVKVNPGSASSPNAPFYQDSVDLGHAGSLAACYFGHKAIVPLSPGHHVIRVDLSSISPATHFTYNINVKRD